MTKIETDKKPILISPASRIPLGWALAGLVGMGAATLFLADIQASARINSNNHSILEKRVGTLENDLKTELRAIRQELTRIRRASDD